MATTEIGGFQEVEEIGHGGMAVVYRAVETTSRQVVAIKLMSVELSGDLAFRKRFQREADVLQHFRHPAIVPILGHGEHGGQPYLVMPFLSGGTLADRLKGGPRPPGEVALLARIAGALDSAHRQGIIHRDVKPTNILFDAAGRPYLTDFGIVKLLGDTGTSVTQTGASLGTPGYMSPEQVRAQPLDGRCDVYALGVVLFEMLTGRLPYTATNPYAQAFQHVADPIPNLRAINPALAAGWQPIIERALAKERENRYPTAWAIIQDTGSLIDLSAPVLSPGGSSARPPTPSIRAAADPGAMPPNRAAPEVTRHTPTEPLAAGSVGRQASPLAADGKLAGQRPLPSSDAAPRPAARAPAGRDGRTIAIILLVVVALLALGGAAWLLLGGGPGASPAGTPTPTLPLSPTPTPPATPIPGQPALRLTRDADLRGGPGDDYPLVGQIAAGVAVTIVGRDAAGAWYNVQLGQGRGWLPRDAGELVDAADEPRIPVAGTIPPTGTTAADTATATLTPTATATPTLTPRPTTPAPTATRPPPTATRPPPTSTPVPPTPPPPPPTDEPEPTNVPPTEIPPTIEVPTAEPTIDIPTAVP